MLTERAIWTTMPAGFDKDGHLLVSVHVAPRLTSDSSDQSGLALDKFPIFAAWPDHLAHINFKIEIGGVTAGAKLVSILDPNLWNRIFPGTTSVTAHTFQNHAKRNFH